MVESIPDIAAVEVERDWHYMTSNSTECTAYVSYDPKWFHTAAYCGWYYHRTHYFIPGA